MPSFVPLRRPPSRHKPVALAVLTLCTALPAWADEGDDAIRLPAVTVDAAAPRHPPSAQTGSYTVPAVSVGSKIPASLKETPQSVSVITHRRIEEQNMTSLEDAMAQTTGVTVDLSGTAVVPAFYSRGFPIEYFQFDGVPLQTGGSSWTQPDLLMYDRVEMLRGAAGLFNGAGQPGGVINLVRKRPTAAPHASVVLSAGSWDSWRGEIDGSSALNESGTVRGRVAMSYAEQDYPVNIANSERTALYGILEADLGPRTRASVGVSYQKRDWVPPMMGLPRYKDGGDLGLGRKTFLSTPWSHWNFETTQLFADLTHDFNDDWQLKISASGERETSDLKYAYVSGAVDRVTLAGPKLAGGANAYRNSQLGIDAMLSGAFQAFGRRHEVVVGGNLYRREADADGGVLPGFGGTAVDVFNFHPGAIADPGSPRWTSKNRTDTRQSGLYGVARLKLADPLTLILGSRVSWWQSEAHNRLTGATSSDYRQNGRVTPYAGIVYDLDPTWSLYASYADIFRVQSDKLDESGGRLPPVIGANYEAGIKGAWFDGGLNASFAVFRIDETHRAVLVSPVAAGGCCYADSGKVQSQGFETELSGQLSPGWQMAAGYTWNHSEYKSDPTAGGQNFRSFTPRHLLRVWTSYQLPGEWNRWDIGGGVSAQSAIFSEGGRPSVRVAQGGYAVWNARVGYRFDKTWSASLNVNNLFDREYYQRLGSSGFGPASFGNVYGDPRNATLAVRASF